MATLLINFGNDTLISGCQFIVAIIDVFIGCVNTVYCGDRCLLVWAGSRQIF